MRIQIYRYAIMVKALLVIIVGVLVYNKEIVDASTLKTGQETMERAESSVSRMSSLASKGQDGDYAIHLNVRLRQILSEFEICNSQRKILDTSSDSCKNP